MVPNHVREGRPEVLGTFIKNTLSGTHNTLQMKGNDIRNNLSKKERDSLNLLPNYKNIMIKPSDKCGKVVVTDKGDFEKTCHEILQGT